MIVLVDTSIWIRFLGNHVPYAAGLDTLLSRDEVVGHELIYGELLAGERNSRKKLLAAYEQMPLARTIPHRDVVEFVRYRRLSGCGVGWIGIHLLASAIVGGFQLWTADRRLSAVSKEIGIQFE